MKLELLVDYIEQKAAAHPAIQHDPEYDKKAFYVIDDPYDLSEFDNAIRNFTSFPAMLLEFGEGMLDDNRSANYTDTVNLSFMIVDKRADEASPRTVRFRCLEIAKEILIQIRKDRMAGVIVPGQFIDFRLDSVQYTPVGPMVNNYFGYLVSFQFICPFTF